MSVKRCMQLFGGENPARTVHLEDLVDNIKKDLKEIGWMLWTDALFIPCILIY
jgi:hypothetical protein